MSVFTDAYVCCDGTIPSDATKSGTTGCREELKGGEQPDAPWVFPSNRAEARRLAKAHGWFFVRHPRLSSVTYDYCPAHEDQARAKADEYGVKLAGRKTERGPGDAAHR